MRFVILGAAALPLLWLLFGGKNGFPPTGATGGLGPCLPCSEAQRRFVTVLANTQQRGRSRAGLH